MWFFSKTVLVVSFVFLPLATWAKFGVYDCSVQNSLSGGGDFTEKRYTPSESCFGNVSDTTGAMSHGDIKRLISNVRTFPSLDWGAAIDPDATQGFDLLKVVDDVKMKLPAGLSEKLKMYASTKALLNGEQLKDKYLTYLEVMAIIEKQYPGKYQLFPGVDVNDKAKYDRLKAFTSHYNINFQEEGMSTLPVEAVSKKCFWKIKPTIVYSKCGGENSKVCLGTTECHLENGMRVSYQASCSVNKCDDAGACLDSDSGIGNSKSCNIGIVDESDKVSSDADVQQLLKKINLGTGVR